MHCGCIWKSASVSRQIIIIRISFLNLENLSNGICQNQSAIRATTAVDIVDVHAFGMQVELSRFQINFFHIEHFYIKWNQFSHFNEFNLILKLNCLSFNHFIEFKYLHLEESNVGSGLEFQYHLLSKSNNKIPFHINFSVSSWVCSLFCVTFKILI